jgi:hypothetical protein
MNDKIKNFLLYTGIIGSIISAISYLIMTWVIVVGFTTAVDQDKQILFAVLGALVGLVITSLLRGQGINFARKEDESQKIMAEYHLLINKKKTIKQMHTIKYYVIMSTIQDIFTKALTIGISTWFILFIFMEGNGDFSLFLLAISNLFMFAGFGLVALSKSYDKYIEEHIPVIKQIIIKLKEKYKIENDEIASIQSEEIKNANIQIRKIFITATTSSTE